MKYKFRRKLIYIILRAIIALIYPLPLELSVIMGKWLGRLTYYLLPKYRFQTIHNLAEAFKSKSRRDIEKIAREVFENQGRTLAELVNFPKINTSNIDRLVTAEGMEKVDEALKKGNGVIMLTAHLGNWELLAAYFGLKGYAPSVIARKLRYEKYDSLINSMRQSKNINVLIRGDSFRSALKALKHNQVLGILPDQDIDSIEGVFVDFFGRKAYTTVGPVALAMASKAVFLPCYIIRQDGRHKIFVNDPLELENTGNREQDYLSNTAKWSRTIEGYISKYPSQWVWMHRRWKTKCTC